MSQNRTNQGLLLGPFCRLTGTSLEPLANFQTVSPRTWVNRVPKVRVGGTHGPARDRRPLSTPGAVGKGGRRLAVLALVVTMAIWGSSFVVTTLVLDEAGPFAVTLLRFGLGLLFLLPFAYRRGFRLRL